MNAVTEWYELRIKTPRRVFLPRRKGQAGKAGEQTPGAGVMLTRRGTGLPALTNGLAAPRAISQGCLGEL